MKMIFFVRVCKSDVEVESRVKGIMDVLRSNPSK